MFTTPLPEKVRADRANFWEQFHAPKNPCPLATEEEKRLKEEQLEFEEATNAMKEAYHEKEEKAKEAKNSFFSPQDVATLESRWYARFVTLRREEIIERAVKYWYDVCMMRRDIIFNDLLENIDKSSDFAAFTKNHVWSHAFTFTSFRNGKLDPSEAPYPVEFFSHNMWHIYRSTDFRKKLLQRLELDPALFAFKNLSDFDPNDTSQRIVENNVHLVYMRPKNK